MASNYTAHAGNVYVFDTLSASGEADLEFDKPVKRIKFEGSVGFIIQDTNGDDVGFINDVAEFPNKFGYPIVLHVKNPDAENTVAPTVQVFEYGDAICDGYFYNAPPEPEPETE